MSADDLREMRDATREDMGHSVSARYLPRLLVVRSAGHIEFVLDQCIFEYAKRLSQPRVYNYVYAHLFKGRGVSPAKLIEKVGWLDRSWAEDLEAFLKKDDERLRRELKFLVDKRNRIAHGQNDGIAARKAIDLSETSLTISEWLVGNLDPDRRIGSP